MRKEIEVNERRLIDAPPGAASVELDGEEFKGANIDQGKIVFPCVFSGTITVICGYVDDEEDEETEFETLKEDEENEETD